MKTRILSSLIMLVILAVSFALWGTLLFNVIIAAIAVVAVYELMNATGCTAWRSLSVLSILIALSISFAQEQVTKPLIPQAIFILVLILFLILLRHHHDMSIEKVALVFLFSTFVPVFFSCAIYLRNDFGTTLGGFYLFWALGSAWLCDTGAYFCGLMFGKHKMAPVISPKKTVEGAVGGIVVSTLLMLVVAWIYQSIMNEFYQPMVIRYGFILLLTPVFALIGMLGDLFASVIKRQYGIKDYGNVIPGHGGVMDRFDSVLFTLPAVYVFVRHVSIAVLA